MCDIAEHLHKNLAKQLNEKIEDLKNLEQETILLRLDLNVPLKKSSNN